MSATIHGVNARALWQVGPRKLRRPLAAFRAMFSQWSAQDSMASQNWFQRHRWSIVLGYSFLISFIVSGMVLYFLGGVDPFWYEAVMAPDRALISRETPWGTKSLVALPNGNLGVLYAETSPYSKPSLKFLLYSSASAGGSYSVLQTIGEGHLVRGAHEYNGGLFVTTSEDVSSGTQFKRYLCGARCLVQSVLNLPSTSLWSISSPYTVTVQLGSTSPKMTMWTHELQEIRSWSLAFTGACTLRQIYSFVNDSSTILLASCWQPAADGYRKIIYATDRFNATTQTSSPVLSNIATLVPDCENYEVRQVATDHKQNLLILFYCQSIQTLYSIYWSASTSSVLSGKLHDFGQVQQAPTSVSLSMNGAGLAIVVWETLDHGLSRAFFDGLQWSTLPFQEPWSVKMYQRPSVSLNERGDAMIAYVNLLSGRVDLSVFCAGSEIAGTVDVDLLTHTLQYFPLDRMDMILTAMPTDRCTTDLYILYANILQGGFQLIFPLHRIEVF